MKRYWASLMCALGLVGLAHGETMNPQQFTQAFVKALAAAQPDAAATIKRDLEVAIRYPGDGTHNAFLDNAYLQYQREPKELRSVLDTVVAALGEARAKAAPIDRTRIVPIVKDRRWLAELQAAVKAGGGTAGFENVVEELNDELVVVYAEDTPKNINYFSARDFAQTGVARTELRALAVANLKRLIREPQVRPGRHATMITAGGNYEASLLLFDDLWASLPKTTGERVIVVPTRDVLLFADSADKQGIATLREAAADLSADSPYRLTNTLFVRRNGRLVRYE